MNNSDQYSAKWELIITYKDGSSIVFPVENAYNIIGRAAENEITLADKGVSRKHLSISLKDGKLIAKDLGSKNGTLINNIFIQEKELSDQDIIRIGSSVITVEKVDNKEESLLMKPDDETEAFLRNSGTIIHPLKEIINTSVISSPRKFTSSGEPAPDHEKLITEQSTTIDKLQNIIQILNKISALVNKTIKLDSLLDDIMALLFDIFMADRGFIFLLDDNSKKLKIRATRAKSQSSNEGSKISTTILNKVYNDRVAIITSNAVMDPRFEAGASIHMYGIRSVISVPLWLENLVIGVIYMDSLISENIFTEDDMSLLTTIANNIALAIHKVRLTDNIISERNIRNNLQRYFSPNIVEAIVNNIGKEINTLDLQKTTLSVLFCDIKDFSGLSEVLPPPQVAIFLNKYLNAMTSVIFKNGGIVDKFLGDGVMALFGAPHYDPFNPLKAVRCGLEMINKVESINIEMPADQKFTIRVGINTGKVVAGNLGSDIRMEYTALGDTVNVASRLESISRPQCVTIGKETYLNTKNYFSSRPLGELQLKGKKQKVLAYELTGDIIERLPHDIDLPDNLDTDTI